MTDFSSISIPKPLNWQDFERNCRILFGYILNDPCAQLNGRSGQRQNGVDIWGRRGAQGTNWVGVQCKGKNADYGHDVTEKELRTEVKKALKFRPTLKEFILATTAPRVEIYRDISVALLRNVVLPGNGFRDYLHRWLQGHFFPPLK